MKSKLTFCSVISILLMLLASCNNIADSSSRDIRSSERVTVALAVSDVSRTIMPTAMDYSDTSKVILTAEKLNITSGKYESYNLDGSTTAKTWTALTDADEDGNSKIIKGALYNMEESTLTLEIGTYNFALEVYTWTSSTDSTEHLSQTAVLEAFEVSASTETISFTTTYAGNGSLALTFKWAADSDKAGKIGRIDAGLFTLESKGETAATDASGKVSYDYEELTLTSDSDAYSAVYAKSGLPNGTYLLKYRVYDSYGTNVLNTIADFVKIHGFKTEEEIEIDLSKINLLYSVSYVLNGGAWKDGAEERFPSARNCYTSLALPTEDDVSRDGYELLGWYTDTDLTEGNEISEITAGTESAKDYILYAKWRQAATTTGSTTTDNRTLSIAIDKTTLYLNSTVTFTATDSDGAEVTSTEANPLTWATQLLYKGADVGTNYYTVSDGTLSLSTANTLPAGTYQLYVTVSQPINGTTATDVTATSSQTFTVTVLDMAKYTFDISASDYPSSLSETASKLSSDALFVFTGEAQASTTGSSPDVTTDTTYSNVLSDIKSKLSNISYKYALDLKDVTVTKPTEIVASSIYSDVSNLKSVILPEELTTVGYYAFARCTALESVTFGSKIETIESDGAFMDCTALTTVNIPQDAPLTLIGSQAFRGCTALTSITLPSTITAIGKSAFYQCENLETLGLSESGTWYYTTVQETWDSWIGGTEPSEGTTETATNVNLTTATGIGDSYTFSGKGITTTDGKVLTVAKCSGDTGNTDSPVVGTFYLYRVK